MFWGSIIGFASYHYKFESGREGDFLRIGFNPRKDSLFLYITGGFETIQAKLDKIGKHKTGKGCLYIKNLADVNM